MSYYNYLNPSNDINILSAFNNLIILIRYYININNTFGLHSSIL